MTCIPPRITLFIPAARVPAHLWIDTSGERDAYMADALRTARGKLVVAVTGMAHMDGIERNLVSVGGYKIEARRNALETVTCIA